MEVKRTRKGEVRMGVMGPVFITKFMHVLHREAIQYSGAI